MSKIINPRPFIIPYTRALKQRLKKKGIRRFFYTVRRFRRLLAFEGSHAFYRAEEADYLKRAKAMHQSDKTACALSYYWRIPFVAAAEKKRQAEEQACRQYYRYITLVFSKCCRAMAWSMGANMYIAFLPDERHPYFSSLLVMLHFTRYFVMTLSLGPWGEYWTYKEITADVFESYEYRVRIQTMHAPLHLKSAIERSDEKFKAHYIKQQTAQRKRLHPTPLDL